MLSDREQQLYGLFAEIPILEQRVRSYVERALPAGLTPSQFAILGHFISHGGEWAPLRLAQAFHVTKQTMTSTLQRMEAAGLVAIRTDPADGRAKLVGITMAGRAMHHRCLERLGPALALLLDRQPDGLAGALLPLLADLRRSLEQPDSAQG